MKFFERLGLLFSESKINNLIESGVEKHIKDFNSGANIIFSNDSQLAFSAVFACFRVLAETFASTSVQEFKKRPDGDREQTDDTGNYQVLHNKANNLMSAYNWAESSMYQLNSGGYSVSIRQKNYLGELVGLFPLDWKRVKIQFEKCTNELEYIIDNDSSKKLKREDVFHVIGPSVDGITGMSILEIASSASTLGLSYEKFGNSFFKNGAIPSGVFEHPSALNPESFKRFKEDLKKNYTGMMNAGAPMILEDGLKFNQLTMKLVDAEFLSSRKFQVEELCRYCRVPLHLVQSLDRATNNNIEHLSLEFVMYSMLPHFKRYESCINNQLLTPKQVRDGYYYEYNINSLIRGDMKSRYDSYSAGRQWGFLSVNDIRRLENMPRVENGNIYMQPLNMIEAGKQQVDKEAIKQQIQDTSTVSNDVKNEIEKILEGK